MPYNYWKNMTLNMFFRSLRKSLPHLCWTTVEETKDNHKEKHTQSSI